MIPSFETTFAVPLSCEACINDVSGSLRKLAGIEKVSANLQTQLVSVEGTAAPSAIVAAIQGTGRDAILRGSGRADSAAVCILETHSSQVPPGQGVRGLARLVQVSSDLTIIDLSLRGVSSGTYYASIREGGDISHGPASVGGVWEASKERLSSSSTESSSTKPPRGVLSTIEVSKSGLGTVFLDKPIQVWELIGRSIVVTRRQEDRGTKLDKEDPDTLVGVIARSAGVWDNDKTVCSCSGKTVWEERKEQVDKGML